ncbi:class I SAM-dependent methyltransferase [Haloferula chungangensis]|uniref:Class I SAM-dependent methyltransferase n=1 Tax=Haloferula chungangensis TaxID=1048331 RepID=A0ABW2L2G1_9BACT
MSSHYTSLEAELHDVFWSSEESPEFEWLDSLLKNHPGRALEIGCGSGRLLLPLIKNGHTIEGLESSSEMLEMCRISAQEQELSPTLHLGDMTSFAALNPYHCVLVPAFTFQLSDDPIATLKNFKKLLIPGGLLYLTVFIPYAEIDGELPENEWYPDHELTLPDGRHASIRTKHQLDRRKRLLKREHHYQLTDGEEIREHRSKQSIRWFSAHQLAKLIADVGFIVETAVADFDEQLAVDEDSQIITLVARKKSTSATANPRSE